ncbi:AsmA family protein [Marinobacter zhanjiangensis]|uniref:AsmA domain-containing protein n=1 Tax=Marinobacter zhanjiangensis TaxID=578215 RepID=A0ABQ3ASB9_9GAMM|nr:AsmA family protein [Marinobacter zhanjiangensis]GGY65790.1 hypothetical protein GCM10007071_10700 [Marinobacter zhanjiangensis]
MPKALLKTLGWVLAGIVALLVVTVVVVTLMPWNFLKAPITERVEAATGRNLEIRGDVYLGLLPRPHIELEQLAFANADWAQAPEMLTIRKLEITPSVTNLISGDLVLDEVDITNPTLYLEDRDQKPGNWLLPAMTSSGQTGETGDKDPDSGGPPVTIRQLNVSEAEIRYLAPGTDTARVLSLPSLQVSRDSISVEAVASPGTGDEGQGLPVELSADYLAGFTDGQWQLSNIQARVNDVEITGQLDLDTGTSPPIVDGELHSPSINVPEFLAAMPTPPEPSDETGISIPVLPAMAGNLRLTVGKMSLQPVTLDNIEANVDLARHRLILENLSFGIAGGRIEATASLTSTPDFITADAQINGRGVDLQELGMDQEAGHILDAEFDLSLDQIAQSPSLKPRVLLNYLAIRKALATYQTTEQLAGPVSDLDFTLKRAGEPPAPVLSVAGRFEGKPLDMTLEGAPFPRLLDGLAAYPLKAHAQSGQLTAWADTRLGAIISPATFTGKLVLKGTDGRDLEQWVGPVLPPLPEYRLSGRVSRDNQRWSVTSLDGTLGDTELAGEVHFTNADPPRVDIDLNAGRIELARFIAGDENPATSTSSAGASDNGSPLAALRAFNGELALQADTLVLTNEMELANLDVAASLRSGNLEITPLTFNIAGGSWDSTLVLDATDRPASGVIRARFDDIALGRLGDTFTAMEERLGKLSGELDLQITEAAPGEQRQDVLLPSIGRLAFEPSALQFTDRPAGTDMTFNLQTRGLGSGEQAFHVDGEGQYDSAPFSLTFRGDPLLDARDPERPYALDLSSDIVGSQIDIRGSILRPLALKGLDLRLELEGPNPQRLTRLLGLPLPELPRYSVSGDLSLKDQRWAFTSLTGEVGNSDIGGQIFFDTDSRPPRLTADLNSRSVDIEDLGGLVGAEPGTSGSTDSAETSGDRYILPDEPLVSDDWRKLTADVHYRGESVRAAGIPLSNVVIDFTLNEGLAVLDPVRFGVGDGHVDFSLDLDTTPAPPEGTLQLEAKAVNLSEALREWSIAEGTVGTVGGQGKFWVTGASVADLLGSADGGLVMLMTGGRLNALMVELAGLDVAEAFLSWLTVRDPIPIDCAYMDLQAREGLIRLDTLAVDTTDTTFTGTGTVSMDTERLDLVIHAHPKDMSPLSAGTPLQLGGTLNNIAPGLNEGSLALRAGTSVALAALASPVVALLPLLDVGSGNEVPYCDGLVSRAGEAIDSEEDGSNETGNGEI